MLLHRLVERIQCHNMDKTWGQGLTLMNGGPHPANLPISVPVISYVEIQILVSFLSSPK